MHTEPTNPAPVAVARRPTRKRRPHPARRARRVTGAGGFAAIAVLTGCMAAGATSGSSASTTVSADRSATVTAATTATTAATTVATTATVQAATPTAVADTSTKSS
jgi:hypothetical protein